MFSKPTVKSCFFASKMMFQACRFHYLLLFSLSISKIDNDFYLDAKILILKIKRVGPSQYPHTHTSRPCPIIKENSDGSFHCLQSIVNPGSVNSNLILPSPIMFILA